MFRGAYFQGAILFVAQRVDIIAQPFCETVEKTNTIVFFVGYQLDPLRKWCLTIPLCFFFACSYQTKLYISFTCLNIQRPARGLGLQVGK